MFIESIHLGGICLQQTVCYELISVYSKKHQITGLLSRIQQHQKNYLSNHMKYSEILKSLYGSDLDKIINVLQKSVYSTQIKKNKEEDIIIHSGFSFETHKGKRMEILLGLSKLHNQIKIIRQPAVFKSIPQINGLLLSSETDYFNTFCPHIIAKIKEENNDYNLTEFVIKETDDFFYSEHFNEIRLDVLDDPDKRISEIEVITNNNELLKFPLQKRFNTIIFFNGQNFGRYETNRDNNWNDNSENRSIWRNEPGTDNYYDQDGMRRDDEYNPENWQGHDG